jgi:transcriptional regulator with XRE-family HTH domain
MTESAQKILVENLRRLMRARGIDNENHLARVCKINQKTINNLMDTDRGILPGLGTIQRIADGLHLPVWSLFLPNLPAREIDINGFPESVSASSIYLMSSFDHFDKASQKEILGYAAYVLDRSGDTLHRDKIRELAEPDYKKPLRNKQEEKHDGG